MLKLDIKCFYLSGTTTEVIANTIAHVEDCHFAGLLRDTLYLLLTNQYVEHPSLPGHMSVKVALEWDFHALPIFLLLRS